MSGCERDGAVCRTSSTHSSGVDDHATCPDARSSSAVVAASRRRCRGRRSARTTYEDDVVHRVRRDLLPRRVRILGDVDEQRSERSHEEPVVPDLLALLAVHVADRGIGRHGEERKPQPRPLARPTGAPNHRPTRSCSARAGRDRRDDDRAAPPLERLARPRPAEHLEVLLGGRAAPGPVDAGHRELFVAVAEAGDEREPATAGEVERRDRLGEPDRVVQRDEQRVHHHVGVLVAPRITPASVVGAEMKSTPWCSETVMAAEPVLVGPAAISMHELGTAAASDTRAPGARRRSNRVVQTQSWPCSLRGC